MRTLLEAARAAALVACLAGHAAAFSQNADDLIRAHVEELRISSRLELNGEAIASQQLLPRIYERREFEPAWESWRQVDGLLEMIDGSDREGLSPADYHAVALRAARASTTAELAALPPAERAALDILLTDSIILLGYHLRFGKIDPNALDSNWNSGRELLREDPAITVQNAIDAPSLREFASRVIPRAFLYERFKTALAEYRAIEANGGWPAVPVGPTLSPGSTDERVSALAARLAVTGDLPASDVRAGSAAYVEPLVAAVRRFQLRHGLTADGVVGPATLAALNVPVAARIDQLRANLERARWVFYEPESEFLAVNIAGFQLYVVRRGEVVWRTRVQVGRPYRQTPIFRAEMTYVVVNPTWTVPPTIMRNDILPAVRRDPSYLDRREIDVFDSRGARVDPATADWSGRNPPYRLVQRPGPDNALGRIKFMFPNEHAVYLHDTPSRDLFERDSRAFSSGCIRVENPFELAEHLVGERGRARLDAVAASGRTQTVFLDKPITVMLLYWTAEVDADGQISFFPDVYGRDPGVIAALAEPFRAPPAL